MLALADKERRALKHKYLGTEHILLGLIWEGDGVAARVLKGRGLNLEGVRQNVLKELDPNYSPSLETATVPKPEPHNCDREPVDIGKRYDVYCREGDRQVVYRNVLFKGVRTLFQKKEFDLGSEYMELEQANGEAIFVGRLSLVKFCEHGTTPGAETVA